MIVLARNPTRNLTFGFLLSLGILLSLVLGVVTAIVMDSFGLGAGLGLLMTAALIVLEYASADSTGFIYRRWNLAAEWCSGLLNRWLTVMAFLVVRSVGLTERRSARGAIVDSVSGWKARGTVAPNAYRGQYNLSYRQGAGDIHWLFDFVTWSMRSGNRWAFVLTPFLIGLRATEVNKKESVPDNVYTLY